MEREPLKIVVVNNAEPDVREFVDPIVIFISYLTNSRNARLSYKLIEYRDFLKENINEHDAVILSASPFGDDIVDHHMKYYSWLEMSGKPVFGICAGHQIIGCFFGGELIRATEAEVGYREIKIVKDDPLFMNKQIRPAIQHHKDSVSCPDDFIILAESPNCKNQIMRHLYKPIYSTQFHAEKSNKWLIENFITMAEAYKHGVKKL